MNRQLAQSKPSAGGGTKSESVAVDKEKSFRKIADTITIPASEATFEAAAKAEGIRKIELEIAAAAGLLRPISPNPPPEPAPDHTARSLEDLLRMVEDLKNPAKSHNLDLFQ